MPASLADEVDRTTVCGTFETCPSILRMSVHRGRPEVAVVEAHSEVDGGSRAAQTNIDIILPL